MWQPNDELLLYDTAMSYYGTPCVWAGQIAVIQGGSAQFDCGGFTIELVNWPAASDWCSPTRTSAARINTP